MKRRKYSAEHHKKKKKKGRGRKKRKKGIKRPVWCIRLWSTEVTMKVVASEHAIPCSGLPLIFLSEFHKGIFTALGCRTTGTGVSSHVMATDHPAHTIYFCCGMSASCSPWASPRPCSACRLQVPVEFRKGMAALAKPQSRGSLWTVPPSHSSAAGWSRCFCSTSLGLLFLGQAHEHIYGTPQFFL